MCSGWRLSVRKTAAGDVCSKRSCTGMNDTELWLSGVLTGVPAGPALALASNEESRSWSVCGPELTYGGTQVRGAGRLGIRGGVRKMGCCCTGGAGWAALPLLLAARCWMAISRDLATLSVMRSTCCAALSVRALGCCGSSPAGRTVSDAPAGCAAVGCCRTVARLVETCGGWDNNSESGPRLQGCCGLSRIISLNKWRSVDVLSRLAEAGCPASAIPPCCCCSVAGAAVG